MSFIDGITIPDDGNGTELVVEPNQVGDQWIAMWVAEYGLDGRSVRLTADQARTMANSLLERADLLEPKRGA